MPNDVPTHAAELMDRIQNGPIRTGWHWLGYNFTPGSEGFMSVGGALDPVLLLDAFERHQPGDDIGAAWHVGVVAARGEDHPLADREGVRHHRPRGLRPLAG